MNTFHRHYIGWSSCLMERSYPLHGCLSSQEDFYSVLGDVDLRCLASTVWALLFLLLYVHSILQFGAKLRARRNTMPINPDGILVLLYLLNICHLFQWFKVIRQKLQQGRPYSTFNIPPLSALWAKSLVHEDQLGRKIPA